MTMLSCRVDEDLAQQLRAWADRLGVDRSQVLREALRRHLNSLNSQLDAEIWQRQPLSKAETALSAVEDWGPAEDWADWADATR